MSRRLIFAMLLLLGGSGPGSARQQQSAATREISLDRLWAMQPQLIERAVGALPPRKADRTNVYALAVAAGGKQPLFTREAKLALDVAAARFGADYRGGLLLTNGSADLLTRPLALPATVMTAAKGIGARLDPARDIAFVYLSSHGSPDATLETDLATFDRFVPVSARSVASALKTAGIRRRVIIVSACFAGSWAPALATADTILIAAARRDRTSFGCDNTRRLTFFGEAMLEGPLAKGASLHEAFDAARAKVAGEEAAEKLLPSLPQAYVGRNMRAFWDERADVPSPSPPLPPPSAVRPRVTTSAPVR